MSTPLKSVGSISRSRHLNLDVICSSRANLDLGMATSISSVQRRIAIDSLRLYRRQGS